MVALGEIKKGYEIGFIGRYKYTWIACIDCGRERWVQLIELRQGKGRTASERCGRCCRTGARHSSWKGGRLKNAKGYARVWVSRKDFFRTMADRDGYVLEHRLVMAKHLNRCLLSWEIVHHKNGVRDDNRLDNLEVFPGLYRHTGLTRMTNYIKKLQEEIKQLKHQLRTQ